MLIVESEMIAADAKNPSVVRVEYRTAGEQYFVLIFLHPRGNL